MSKKSLIVLLLVVGVLVAKSKSRSDWHGLTESEARARLDAKLPGKIPADKRAVISDKMVAKMRERGAIVEEPAVADDETEATADAPPAN